MHIALYRAERPQTFDEIIGQEHIVRILRNQIKTGHVSQAYLFTGTRGTGKTTTARILAKAVNCTGENPPCGICANCESIADGSFLDVIELDAASNNGVESLRSIIDSVKYPPVIGRYKVYIIDEVHMLSQAAENAFLKTLEEPPEYVIFILATTDPEKVRATIKSRCMRLNFKRVSEEDLIAGMKKICGKHGISAEKDALGIIAEKADGSVRDALGILEQCMATGEKELDSELVLDYTGTAGKSFYAALTDAVVNSDMQGAVELIDNMIAAGKEARRMLADWLVYCRDMMIVKNVRSPERYLNMSSENIGRIAAQAKILSCDDILRYVRIISEKINIARYSPMPRTLLELTAVELMGNDKPPVTQIDDLPKGATGEVAKKVDHRVNHEAQPENTESPENFTDYEDMWSKVVAEMPKTDTQFHVMVAKNSAVTKYRNDEITLTVKPNKLPFAERASAELDAAAKKLFGERTFFTFKPGDVGKIKKDGGRAGADRAGVDAIDREESHRDSGNGEVADSSNSEDLKNILNNIGGVLDIDPSEIEII